MSGWRWPRAGTRPGSVTSTAPAGRRERAGALDVGGPPRLDRLLQFVRKTADVALVLGGGAGDQLHPGRDDAVLAAEIPVADRLRLAIGGRRGEVRLECRNLRLDGVCCWKSVGHETGGRA